MDRPARQGDPARRWTPWRRWLPAGQHGARRPWTLRMDPEPPDHYVAFVERHLSALTSEAVRLVGDRDHAELVYPDALEDVAARWSWLEIRTTLGGHDARVAYLRRSLSSRARRWRDQQLYPIEVRALTPYDAQPFEPRQHRWEPVDRPAANPQPGMVPEPSARPASGPEPYDRPGPYARPVGGPVGGPGPYVRPEPYARPVGGPGPYRPVEPAPAPWHRPPAGAPTEPPPQAPRRPVWVSVALRQAELVGDTVRTEARPVAEAAIAWWHAYERHRRYRRAALGIAALLFLVAMIQIGEALTPR